MKQFDFCIMTPSYAPDFHRCKVLAWSVQAFVSPLVKHYIIVPEADVSLFKQIEQPNVEVITVESILPVWIKRIPWLNSLWFSRKHFGKNFLIRGWIIQQIIKLATAEYLTEDVFVIVDSDIAFIRPFDLQNFIDDEKVRLFKVPAESSVQSEIGNRWYRTAHNLLGLENFTLPVPGYIAPIITWRRDNLLKLYEYIEKQTGKKWIEAVCDGWDLSEYMIYGVFVEKVLQETSGHYYNSKRLSHEYWSTEPMTNEELNQFFVDNLSEDFAVMISAKANISMQQYEKLIKGFYESELLMVNS
ncbi:MAG: hypothetical protein HC903_11800 [Methylacidiphilales bacterium]|nr:hypothetical protein [Candidatus Methylacidiphilales bacterium]